MSESIPHKYRIALDRDQGTRLPPVLLTIRELEALLPLLVRELDALGGGLRVDVEGRVQPLTPDPEERALSIEQLQEAVGGEIDVLATTIPEVLMVVNADAEAFALTPNFLAAAIVADRRRSKIGGPVVLLHYGREGFRRRGLSQ
jgi:hypothetical protein